MALDKTDNDFDEHLCCQFNFVSSTMPPSVPETHGEVQATIVGHIDEPVECLEIALLLLFGEIHDMNIRERFRGRHKPAA